MARSDEDIGDDLGHLLNQANHALAMAVTTRLAELGITPRDYDVLSKAMGGELAQGELAQRALLDKTTMVVTLDQLEQAGLAERRPSVADRRARIVVPTDAGAQVVERAQGVVSKLYADVLGALPVGQRAAFMGALVRLVGEGGPLATAAPGDKPPRQGARRAPHPV